MPAKTKPSSKPTITIHRYATSEELTKAHPKAQWHQYGPILSYQGEDYVQVYFGGHEWRIINLSDPTQFYDDPGWTGKEIGFAFVNAPSKDYWKKVCNQSKKWKATPKRTGKPVTQDQILFATPKKLAKYLGPKDPITKSLKKGK